MELFSVTCAHLSRKETEMKKCHVIIQPSGRRGEVSEGKTVLEASRELGIDIESVCGGKGVCGKCKVKLEEGFFERNGITSLSQNLSPFSEEEKEFIDEGEREKGYRLGCVAQIRGDVLIYVPEESQAQKQVVRKAVAERSIELRPAVSLHFVELSPPTFDDPLGDFDRLKKVLNGKHNLAVVDIDYHTLLKLPSILRRGDWKITVAIWMGKEIIDIRPGTGMTSTGWPLIWELPRLRVTCVVYGLEN